MGEREEEGLMEGIETCIDKCDRIDKLPSVEN